jgi:hypothetical protein
MSGSNSHDNSESGMVFTGKFLIDLLARNVKICQSFQKPHRFRAISYSDLIVGCHRIAMTTSHLKKNIVPTDKA